ncbi:MAG: addiction module protein [Aeromicrobium sp.]|uniref:addiction module protein n=1 Tax=Aeromicrobium sp. TaxID=1871063 RepID=UPI0039E224E6
MIDQSLLEQAKQSSVDERLAVIGALWDSIDHQGRPVPSSTAALVDARVAEAAADPLVGRSWQDIKADWRRER